mmetsp:Transcript_13412/g.39543  ORF Transcript_13412/g.39543 Transcript_13412/m.39543 type:complete len:110 (-) Transcript_13412:309-638(-)
MDDAVNQHLLDNGVGYLPRFVAASSCRYFEPLSYPVDVDVGLRVEKLGKSSVTYSIGLFAATPGKNAPGDESAAACGSFVHVWVDKAGRPSPLNDEVRAILEGITTPSN